MKTFRIVVGILATIPLGLLVDSIFLHPSYYGVGSLGELFYPMVGVPILTLNLWAWIYPEIIKPFLFGKGKSPNLFNDGNSVLKHL